MKPPQRRAARGRPPSITRERIIEAGIGMGLSDITFVGIAAALGVSHMALYKHVAGLDELKRLVAEEIFNRWELPLADGSGGGGLKAYLQRFAASLQAFVKAHPGVTPYVIRRQAATRPMLARIDGHQRHIAEAYGLSLDRARWLLATVAFHTLAVADTVYSVAGREPVVQADRATEEAAMEQELVQGLHALIIGALALPEENPPSSPADAAACGNIIGL
ncbi:MAG: TetR family transcriptional regulator [Tistrella sp.]|uniref:TetR family transcriptional regulator n=1 Tax=Tistrella mobilis TaxID=171437 RepID=A0A3B9IVS2_9PROT|nr:TetR/AcrR family transcriptional regulator [Tistrella sp.]MAD38722.1 TetR family transcriptional regulator [Tistrella sp.]MBA76742.1 TetR family transcriptional regulator [Tistrella sp.]HAE51329.1 TetR family transcriptional regulator [Tistrella mobilis]